MTQNVYFHLLIYMQLELSNLFADCTFVKAWCLPSLSTTIGSKVEKPIGHNWPSSIVIKRWFPHQIARVVAR